MTTIRHQLETSKPANEVLAALTTKNGLQGWWSKDCDVGEGEGAAHELRFEKGGQKVVMKFVVEKADAGGVRWRCTDNGNPVWKNTTLEWTWSADGGGTKIDFAHAGFEEDQSPPYQMTVEGWGHFMNSLKAYLDDGQGMPS